MMMQIVSENIKQKSTDNEKLNKKFDYGVAILILQMITVGLLIAIAVILKLTGGELYNKVSGIYKEKTGEVTNVRSVLDDDGGRINKYTPDNGDEDKESALKEVETRKKDAVIVSAAGEILQPVVGTVTSEYGYRIHPISGEYKMHSGLDIAADTGTKIKCAYDGTVTQSDYSSTYGYYIKVEHSDNFATVYAHCSKLLASVGDNVKKGDTLALVGSTGVSTGAHLHFEVVIYGEKIDPRRLLTTVCEV